MANVITSFMYFIYFNRNLYGAKKNSTRDCCFSNFFFFNLGQTDSATYGLSDFGKLFNLSEKSICKMSENNIIK